MAGKTLKSSAALELEQLAAMAKVKNEEMAAKEKARVEGQAHAMITGAVRDGTLGQLLAAIPGLEGLGAGAVSILEEKVKLEEQLQSLTGKKLADLNEATMLRMTEDLHERLEKDQKRRAAEEAAEAARRARAQQAQKQAEAAAKEKAAVAAKKPTEPETERKAAESGPTQVSPTTGTKEAAAAPVNSGEASAKESKPAEAAVTEKAAAAKAESGPRKFSPAAETKEPDEDPFSTRQASGEEPRAPGSSVGPVEPKKNGLDGRSSDTGQQLLNRWAARSPAIATGQQDPLARLRIFNFDWR